MSQEKQNEALVRRAIEAFNRMDFDAALADAAPDAAVDMSHARGPDAGVYVGHDAIRRFWTELTALFERHTMSPEGLVARGDHVVVSITAQMKGRGGIEVEAKSAAVATLRDGRVVRWTIYQDRAEALAAVGVEEDAVSDPKVEIVRRLIALGEEARKSGLTSPPLDLASPDMEIDLSHRVFNPETYRGVDGWVRLNEEMQEVWAEWRVVPERIVAAGDRVVSIENVRGRGRGSGLETEGRYASVWTFADGRVTRVEVGLDPDEALRAVGLEE